MIVSFVSSMISLLFLLIPPLLLTPFFSFFLDSLYLYYNFYGHQYFENVDAARARGAGIRRASGFPSPVFK